MSVKFVSVELLAYSLVGRQLLSASLDQNAPLWKSLIITRSDVRQPYSLSLWLTCHFLLMLFFSRSLISLLHIHWYRRLTRQFIIPHSPPHFQHQSFQSLDSLNSSLPQILPAVQCSCVCHQSSPTILTVYGIFLRSLWQTDGRTEKRTVVSSAALSRQSICSRKKMIELAIIVPVTVIVP